MSERGNTEEGCATWVNAEGGEHKKYAFVACSFCGLTYPEHRKLDTRCQEGVELDVKIALTEAQQKLHTIFALVEAHYEEAYYRRTSADKKLWQAVLELKGGPPDLKEAVG